MKSIIILFSVLLGSSVLVTHSSPSAIAVPLHNWVAKRANSQPVGTISIIINKSKYELSVYDDKGWYATYPVVFGNNSLEDKKMEGDRNTPEGVFHIVSKRVHEKWDRFIALDYPTKESYERFNERKAEGLIPKNAKIGGGIGIHGTWPHEDYQIDRYQNWTDGCISLKNEHVEEIYSFIQPGTEVTIKH